MIVCKHNQESICRTIIRSFLASGEQKFSVEELLTLPESIENRVRQK